MSSLNTPALAWSYGHMSNSTLTIFDDLPFKSCSWRYALDLVILTQVKKYMLHETMLLIWSYWHKSRNEICMSLAFDLVILTQVKVSFPYVPGRFLFSTE